MSTEISTYNPKLNELKQSTLARDIVLYGGSDLQGVLDAYGLDEQALNAALDEDSLLSKELQRFKKQVDNDPKAAIRMASNEVLTNAVPEIHSLIQNSWTESKDKIKAIELVARLADALPKESKSAATGPMVTINMGGRQAMPEIKPINPPVGGGADTDPHSG